MKQMNSTPIKRDYTTAFVGITLTGELYIIMQFRGTLTECAQWRAERRKEIAGLYGEIREVTIRHK